MKWLKALIGVLVLAGFACGVWYARENRVDVPFIGAIEKPVTLRDGVEVPLVLLTPLDSGGSEEGKEVRLVASEDVVVGKKTVIEQGAIATGKVTRSRAGTLIGAVTNMPARLEIELDQIKTVDGQMVKLRAKALGEPHQFTQANTKPDVKGSALDLVNDQEAREFVVGLARQIGTGQQMTDQDKQRADLQLKELAGRYGLESTEAFFRGSKSGERADLPSLFESVQKGDLGGLSGNDALLAVRAVTEILEVGSSLDRSLRGIFKGNNIHARVGTPVQAYVAEDAKVNGKGS